MDSYYTYILLCADNTLYCGFTNDLKKRLATHNSGQGDAKYTKARLPVKFITSVKFDNEHDARSCEWWFKHKLTRQQKDELVKSDGIEIAYKNWKKARGK